MWLHVLDDIATELMIFAWITWKYVRWIMFWALRAICDVLRLRLGIVSSTILSWRSTYWNTVSILLIISSINSSWNMTAFGTLWVLRAIRSSTGIIVWVLVAIPILRQDSITKAMRFQHSYTWCCLVISCISTVNSSMSRPASLPFIRAITIIISTRPYVRWFTIMDRRISGVSLVSWLILVRWVSIRVCVNDLVRW